MEIERKIEKKYHPHTLFSGNLHLSTNQIINHTSFHQINKESKKKKKRKYSRNFSMMAHGKNGLQKNMEKLYREVDNFLRIILIPRKYNWVEAFKRKVYSFPAFNRHFSGASFLRGTFSCHGLLELDKNMLDDTLAATIYIVILS